MRDGGGGADSQNTPTPVSTSSRVTTTAASAHSGTFLAERVVEQTSPLQEGIQILLMCVLECGQSLTQHLAQLGEKMMDQLVES